MVHPHFSNRLFGIALVLGFISFSASAQNTAATIDWAAKTAKQAGRALSVFHLDGSDKAQLAEAHSLANQAKAAVENIATNQVSRDEEKNELWRIWRVVGDVNSAIANQIESIRVMGFGNINELPNQPDPAIRAAEAYVKAFDFAVKIYQKKDALKGMQEAQSILSSFGIGAFGDRDFQNAYLNFNHILILDKVLKSNQTTSILDDTKRYNEQLYLTGLAAFNAGILQRAKELFQTLYDAGYDKPEIYEVLYNLHKDTDLNRAYGYVEAGRKKFPENTLLLFAEIDYFTKQNRIEELVSRIKTAMAREPNNAALYLRLGSVYDKLYQKEATAGNWEESEAHFNSAVNYYQQAQEKDPSSSDANYSIGALYFNKAANLTREMNESATDSSQAEVLQLFDAALPYFQRAERINPNHVNTLTALAEIYAQKNDLEVSQEFRRRLEMIRVGETIEKSYF